MMKSLLVERHTWETSGSHTQMQIPKAAFSGFFGTSDTISFTANIFTPPDWHSSSPVNAKISYYEKSDTHRFNLIEQLGDLGHAVIVIEETTTANVYNIWWFADGDATAVLAKPHPWQQAKDSHHGPGRYWALLDTPGPRVP